MGDRWLFGVPVEVNVLAAGFDVALELLDVRGMPSSKGLKVSKRRDAIVVGIPEGEICRRRVVDVAKERCPLVVGRIHAQDRERLFRSSNKLGHKRLVGRIVSHPVLCSLNVQPRHRCSQLCILQRPHLPTCVSTSRAWKHVYSATVTSTKNNSDGINNEQQQHQRTTSSSTNNNNINEQQQQQRTTTTNNNSIDEQQQTTTASTNNNSVNEQQQRTAS